MFIITMSGGIRLRFADFLRVRRYPFLVPAIIAGQWAAAILVAGLVGKVLNLSYSLAGGALLVAAAPVAALSNYYARGCATGHLALAVTVTAISTVLAIALTPLAASAGFALFLGSAATVDLPLLKIAQQTVLRAGAAAARRHGDQAARAGVVAALAARVVCRCSVSPHRWRSSCSSSSRSSAPSASNGRCC